MITPPPPAPATVDSCQQVVPVGTRTLTLPALTDYAFDVGCT